MGKYIIRVLLLLLSLHSWVLFAQKDSIIDASITSNYELIKIDTLFHKEYVYLEFINQKNRYDVLIPKRKDNCIYSNLNKFKLKHEYSLNLTQLSYIVLTSKNEEKYFFPIIQYSMKKGSKFIGGSASKVYTLDDMNCNSLCTLYSIPQQEKTKFLKTK